MNDTPQNGGRQVATTTEKRPLSAVTVFQHDMEKMTGQFEAALPKHIPVERFARVVQTAVMGNPDLLKAERKSLWQAAMKAAQDGLLPDGREAALIARKGRVKINGQWQDALQVSYQPMIAGIRKKARNSGEISTWDAQVVCEGDHFVFQLGDEPRIEHSYDLKTERGKMIGAYSVCVLKDGTKSYEVMSLSEIHAIRNRSDAWKAYSSGAIKATPWSSDEGEMARKTVAKRHSKVLPMSTDLDDLMRRDDDLYDFRKETDEDRAATKIEHRPRTLAGKLDAIAGGTGRDPVEEGFDPETGAEIEHDETPAEVGNRQPRQEQAAGDDGKGAGHPATAKPAAAPRRRKPAEPPKEPEQKDEEVQELEPVDDAPIIDGDGPAEDADEVSPPPALTREEKISTLREYNAVLMAAMSITSLGTKSKSFFAADEFPPDGTPLGDAVTAIYQAHHARIMEERPASDIDQLLKSLVASL